MTREERTRVEEVLIHLGLDDDGFLIQLRAEGLFPDDDVNADQADEIRVAAIMVKELMSILPACKSRCICGGV